MSATDFEPSAVITAIAVMKIANLFVPVGRHDSMCKSRTIFALIPSAGGGWCFGDGLLVVFSGSGVWW